MSELKAFYVKFDSWSVYNNRICAMLNIMNKKWVLDGDFSVAPDPIFSY